jgi:hypothetical protein
VTPISEVAEHIQLMDTWISALSRLGLHARHLRLHGTPDVWTRGPVRGITLRFAYADTTIADAVLLWNTDRPENMASDIGSGLERLRWVQTGRNWPEAAFGDHANDWPLELLDAVRTATLLIDAGVRPGNRGASTALNRQLDQIPHKVAAAGRSRLVRDSYTYWGRVTQMHIPWPATSRIIEDAKSKRDSPTKANYPISPKTLSIRSTFTHNAFSFVNIGQHRGWWYIITRRIKHFTPPLSQR